MFSSMFFLVQSCTVSTSSDPTTPNEKDKETQVATNTSTQTSTLAIEPNPLKDVCSYGRDLNKGCIKFVIGTTNLTVGPFHYDLGVPQFVKEFMQDVSVEQGIDLNPGQKLQLTSSLSTYNFFDNFYVTVEGGFSTYPAVNTGYGNLVVNKMAPGSYNTTVSKDFELRITNSNGSLHKALCITIWATRNVLVEAGQESVSSTPINNFEYKVYNQGCNGNYSMYNSRPVEITSPSTTTHTVGSISVDTTQD